MSKPTAGRPALRLGLRVQPDQTTGELLAVYFEIRRGKWAFTKVFQTGVVCADYDRKGNLLGIELLGPCEIQVLDKISRKEPRPVKNFLRNSVPREMALCEA